jgi:hypothetical protein
MILEIIIGLFILVPMAWVCWESTVMISERKARYRAGTHDYYDNPIVKDDDETIS